MQHSVNNSIATFTNFLTNTFAIFVIAYFDKPDMI